MSTTPKKNVVHAGSSSVLLTPSAAPAASRMAGSEQRQRVQKRARTRVLKETRILHEDQAAEAADEVLRNQIKALVGGSGGAAGATEAGDKGGVEARLRHLVRYAAADVVLCLFVFVWRGVAVWRGILRVVWFVFCASVFVFLAARWSCVFIVWYFWHAVQRLRSHPTFPMRSKG